MDRKKILGLAVALVLVSGLSAWADFNVTFDGRPEPPFIFNNEFAWDDPEVGLATMRTNGAGGNKDTQQETNLRDDATPEPWDPTIAGSYEICLQVVAHTQGIGVGAIDLAYTRYRPSRPLRCSPFIILECDSLGNEFCTATESSE